MESEEPLAAPEIQAAGQEAPLGDKDPGSSTGRWGPGQAVHSPKRGMEGAGAARAPSSRDPRRSPGGWVVSQIQLTPEPQLQVTPWKGGWQGFTQLWACSLPSAHMGPRTLGPGCRQRQAGGRTQASQAEPTPEPAPTAPTRPREATEAQGPPRWGPGAVCGMKSHVVPADKPLAMLASKQP